MEYKDTNSPRILTKQLQSMCLNSTMESDPGGQNEDLRRMMIRITLASASAKANETAQGIIGRNVDALWALQNPTACHGDFYRCSYGHLPNAILYGPCNIFSFIQA